MGKKSIEKKSEMRVRKVSKKKEEEKKKERERESYMNKVMIIHSNCAASTV